MRGRLLGVALLPSLLAGCEERSAPPPAESIAPTPTAPTAAASTSAPPSTSTPPSTCAPSLAYAGPLDARTSAALATCRSLRTGEAKASLRCGEGERAGFDPERLLASVAPLDAPTRERIARVARDGARLGRNPRSFGLVGDSITVSPFFLAPFGARGSGFELSPFARDALRLARGGTIVDHYRGARVEPRDGQWHDAFTATRAAKIGARASWAVLGDDRDASPVAELVRGLSPAIAVVAYGANDAAYRLAPPEELADELEQNVLAIVAALERRGVVVILSNEMRHLDQPGVKACPADDDVNDWRIAVAQNATSARMAELACREHLPWIDLRHALDGATNHGVGPDGVHLSEGRHGLGRLDEAGLDCGYDIRSFVTLLALARVVDALGLDASAPSPDAAHDSSRK